MSLAAARSTDGKSTDGAADGLETRFSAILELSRKAVDDAPKDNPDTLDPQAYENALNALAVSLTGSVNVDKRTVVGVSGSQQHGDLFKKLVQYKLKQQAQDGKQVSVEKARDDAIKDLRARSEHAVSGDKGGGKKIDVLDGYWDKQSGKSDAGGLANSAFQSYWAERKPSTDNPDYDDNLNALASSLVGSVNVESRTLALSLNNNQELAQLYQNLITEKLKAQGSPTNLDEAMQEVEQELFDRIGSAAANSDVDQGDIVDVIEGYWDKHAGKDDADGLARQAYDELKASTPPPAPQVSEVHTRIDYDDTLNQVAANMAAGADLDSRTVTPFTDKSIRDDYASLIYAKLEGQRERGEHPNLDAAYDEVKNDLFERLPNALRDDAKADDKMELFDNYWGKHSGKSDAGDVAREAYATFIGDNTVLDNPNYEDNLNALALALGGGTLDDTRTLSGLQDPTLKALYQNLINDKLEHKVSLDDAIAQVKDELFARLGSALSGDAIKNEKVGIVENYWSKHGGEMDANKAAENAYAQYVEAGEPVAEGGLDNDDKKELLTPSATDIMNAETSGGKTVNELYMEKLEAAYKDEPEGSDKEKFLALLKAQNALSGGFGFLPYYYDTGYDQLVYADAPAGLTAEEWKGLVNEDKLQEELTKLAGNDEITADTQKYLQEAVGEVKDKQGLEDRIVATMTSPTYQDELQKADLAAENGAMIRFNGDLNSLNLLNPEKAREVQQNLQMNSTVEKLNDLVESDTGLSEDSLNTAIDDVVYTTVRASVLGSYFGEAAGGLTSAYDDFMSGKKLEDIRKEGGTVLTQDEMDKLKAAKSARDVMSEMMKDSLKSTITVSVTDTDRGWLKALGDFQNSDLDAKLKDAMDKANVLPTEKGKVGEMIKGLAKDGVFGTAGALASIVAATMTLTQAGGNAAATPEERMTSAFYLLFAVSSAPTAVSAIGDPLARLLGKPGVTQALGLDMNGSDVFKGKLIPDPEAPKVNNPNVSNLYKDINARIQTPTGSQVLEAFNKMSSGEQSAVSKTVEKMAKSMGTAYANLSLSDKVKLFGPGLKLVANASYLGGSLLGVYMGADAIAKFDSNTTDLEKTQGALSLTAGLAWTGASFAGAASWLGIGSAAAASTAGTALGAIGIVLSVIGLGIASAIQYDKQKKAADEVRDQLSYLSDLGVMEEDWGDKFNYLAGVEYKYVSDDDPELTDEWYEYYFPEDMPAWEAQPEQYAEFTEKGGETAESWWSTEDLVGHGEQPEGPKYEPQPMKPSDYRG